jgi:hypothetical protein
MEKIKQGLSSIWGYIVLVVGASIAILLYVLNLKNKELDAAKAKIALVNTQKEADALEASIKQDMAQRDLNQKDLQSLQKALDILEEKRQSILKEGNLTDSQVEDYWNKK